MCHLMNRASLYWKHQDLVAVESLFTAVMKYRILIPPFGRLSVPADESP